MQLKGDGFTTGAGGGGFRRHLPQGAYRRVHRGLVGGLLGVLRRGLVTTRLISCEGAGGTMVKSTMGAKSQVGSRESFRLRWVAGSHHSVSFGFFSVEGMLRD